LVAGRKWVGWRIASIVGTFKMATIGVFWSQAVIAELYTAAAALVVAEILLILLWRHKGNWHYLFLAGFLGGLSLGVHNMVALMAPAVLLYMALTVRRFQDWTGAAAGAGLGILIWLTTFLLLDGLNAPSSFFNSVVRPSLSTWGLRSADFDSPFERLIYLFSARQFRDFMFSQPISAMWGNSKAYFETVPWSIIIPSTLGMVSLFVRRWREGLLILVTWICMMIFVLNYDIRDIFVFYIPTYIPLLVTLIYFLGVLSDLANWFFRRLGASRWVNTKVGIFGVIVGLVLLLPGVKMVRDSVLLGSLTYYHEDTYPYPVFHPNLPYDQAKALVDHIEDNAIVFTDWEMLYAYYYVAHVEEGRTGMAFHESFPQGGINDLAETARAYIQANLGARPIYVTRFMPQFTRYFVLKRVLAEVPLYQVEARPY
jgi:hypothetical protein